MVRIGDCKGPHGNILVGRTRINNAKILEIIRSQSLNRASGFNSTTSNTVSFNDRVFLHRDHHFALLSWCRALKDGIINYDNVLLHFDLHPDLEVLNSIRKDILDKNGYPKTRDLAFNEAERILAEMDHYPDLLPEEKFIVNGIELKLIKKYVHIVPGTGHFKNPELNIESTTYSLDKFYSSFLFNSQGSYILDIDLDFFTPSPHSPYDKDFNLPKSIERIIRIIKMAKPKIATIAFSPAASNYRVKYSTLKDKVCSEIIKKILISMGFEEAEITLYPEPRRSLRFSPK